MSDTRKQFAVITGGSTGIGFALARECLSHGFDVLIAAIHKTDAAVAELRASAPGATVSGIETDLATEAGVDTLLAAVGNRRIDALLANAGTGLGGAFIDQEWPRARHIIDTNITGTLYLLHQVARTMKAEGGGKILITGSIAGFIPGGYQAVYNASKAFLDSFSFALRYELGDAGVTVTCLMPGLTETEFFDRAEMRDTAMGSAPKDDPAMVARKGFDAMMKGEGDVVTGWHNKLQAAIAHVAPAGLTARLFGKMSQPGTAP